MYGWQHAPGPATLNVCPEDARFMEQSKGLVSIRERLSRGVQTIHIPALTILRTKQRVSSLRTSHS